MTATPTVTGGYDKEMVPIAQSKYEKWLEPDGLILLQGWARDGLTEEQIAHNMGISARTLSTYKKQHFPILQALKKGKEVVDFAVENALLKKALAGDVTAMIFWLKNRKQLRWRDRHEVRTDESSLPKVKALMDGLDGEAADDTAE
jgi:hypothetical protein